MLHGLGGVLDASSTAADLLGGGASSIDCVRAGTAATPAATRAAPCAHGKRYCCWE